MLFVCEPHEKLALRTAIANYLLYQFNHNHTLQLDITALIKLTRAVWTYQNWLISLRHLRHAALTKTYLLTVTSLANYGKKRHLLKTINLLTFLWT